MWTFRALRWAVFLLVAVIGGMVKTHPKEAESNTAAWLDSVGFSSWGESFTPVTDDWILAGCIAVAVLLACSFFIPRARLNHADAAAIKQSPGNGWRVSRRMMNLWSMRKVEALCQDFSPASQDRRGLRISRTGHPTAQSRRWNRKGFVGVLVRPRSRDARARRGSRDPSNNSIG